jgi:hypothetical protein
MSKIIVDGDIPRPILTIPNHTHEELVSALRDSPRELREAVLNLFNVVNRSPLNRTKEK